MIKANWVKIELFKHTNILSNLYTYEFKLCRKINKEFIKDQKIFPFHYAKLGIFNNSNDQIVDERYYSLLNNPYIETKINDDVSFKFYIKDNPKLPNKSMSFPYKLRNLDKNLNTCISYPYGDLSYQGNSNFQLNKNESKKCKNIVLICGGTGVVPMKQLIDYLIYEKANNLGSIPLITLFYCDSQENPIFKLDLTSKLSNISNKNYFSYSIDNYHQNISNTEANLKAYLNNFDIDKRDDTLFFICGPELMKTNLHKLICNDYKFGSDQVKFFV